MRFTPDNIKKLEAGEVFVFGSNLAGKHGKGAAKTALDKFGAVYGNGKGIQGHSYAIPTKGYTMNVLSLESIEKEIREFLIFADNNRDKIFLTTKIGCGLAGYTEQDIAKLFSNYLIPDNVVLPESFWKYFDQL